MQFVAKRGVVGKFLTLGLVAALPVMLQPAAAQPLAGVKGTVFTGQPNAPLAGARVHLVQVGTKAVFTSTVSDAAGAFDLRDVPVASYEAAVEFEGGLYVVKTPVVILEGRPVNLNLSLPRLVDAAGQRPERSVAGTAGILGNPLAATLIVVGSAVSVGALIDAQTDDDPVASEFLY